MSGSVRIHVGDDAMDSLVKAKGYSILSYHGY
jgi:hypothetical protein